MKRKEKLDEYRGSTDEQLTLTLRELEKNLFHLRFQSATDRLETPSEIRKAKKDIARVLTIRDERLRKAEQAVQAKKEPARG